MGVAIPRRDEQHPLLVGYVAVLAATAVALALLLERSGTHPPGRASWTALPVLAALLVAAEYLFIKFRYGGEINALNLVEAVLAPLVFAFPPVAVVATVAAAQLVAGLLRRNTPVKVAFNIAQWSLAAAVGVAGLAIVAGPGARWETTVVGILLALALVGLFNQIAFAIVLSIANRQRLTRVLAGLAPAMIPGWLLGWTSNTATGLLFVFAYAAHPGSVVLFPVPLVVLHLAYRGYAGARSDRVRLTGLHRAARVLADPLDPSDAIGAFLHEVARSFEARGASLVLDRDGVRTVYRVTAAGGASVHIDVDERSFESRVLAEIRPLRVTAVKHHALRDALVAEGWSDCLAAPLVDGGRVVGVLIVYDQSGLEGFEAGELAVLEALAREAVAAFAKGKLVRAIVEERRKLAEIVTTTSDGILTIASDGTLRSWNPAMERITGVPAEEVVGLPATLEALATRAQSGVPVRLDRWASDGLPPPHLLINDARGGARRLSCSYSHVSDPDGEPRTLVVIARDVSHEEEMRELRKDLGRLAQAEAAQRALVEQLQQTLMPARLAVPGIELGVSYLPSDPTAPTGGDLYDWTLLPSGELHVAVVDVLGHGVAATKNGADVMHALRLLALQGCPLEQMIAHADELLCAQNPDIVATAIIVRYDPATGRARVATGGHPPALVASPQTGVREIETRGGAIGWPSAGSTGVAEIDVAPGDSLILYTDGIVEATKNIIEGTETLMRRALALVDRPAEELARALIEASVASGLRRDDSLALVLRRTPIAGVEAAWREPSEIGRVREIRHHLSAWLAEHAVPSDDIADLELIAAELLSNAAKAARSTVELRARLDGTQATIEVVDDGPGLDGLDHVGLDVPPLAADTGRGLFIVRSLTSDMVTERTEDGYLVRAIRPLGAADRFLTSSATGREDQHA